MKKQENLKILYLQIRKDKTIQEQEFAEFVRFSGLEVKQFTVLNVFDTPHFEPVEVMTGHDAFFVGGTSDDGDSLFDPGDFDFLPDSFRLILYCYENKIPSFCSCFGFQMAVKVLGKEIIMDKEHMEMGTYPIRLTDAAHDDIIFKDTPDGFVAVSGHKKRAVELPDGAINLAYTDLCPYHAFKFPDRPFYAFQFHPEVDKIDLIDRITLYLERYKSEDSSFLQNIIDTAQDTTESNNLVRKFVERILLK